ncbi:MAG: HMG-CoA synthase [Promethearchaeota archaeon CR_4]|nr:MAG: HMG-CoA synthase [Candidatus Lokiarchaeota archaeon CR_4]
MQTPPFLDIGIDGIGFYVPQERLRLADLAHARGVDPAKYIDGLMLEEFAVPDYGEDAVSMALMASNRALLKSGIDPHSIDCVLVGTESAAYAVKSIAAILSGMLGISEHAFTGDLTHACASATCSIINAIGLISAGLIKRALVIGTDVSKYPIGSAGEPTQGAGAIALIISRNPRIARFSANFGKISGHVNDFFRPNGQDTAIVYGHYSIDAYLSFQQHAYDDLSRQIGPIDPNYWIFHSPYAKLPVQFFRQLMLRRKINDSHNTGNGSESLGSSFPSADQVQILKGKGEISCPDIQLLKNLDWNDFEICDLHHTIQQELRERLLPSLFVSRHFGNMYSASVWSQVMWVLENYARDGDVFYFGSYGSGATAISGLLQVQPNFRSIIDRPPIMLDSVRTREYLTVKSYEEHHENNCLILPKITLGRISTLPTEPVVTKNIGIQGISLSFCDAGCVLPHNKDLSYCPQGHFGRFNRFFPQSAKITHLRKTDFIDPLLEIAHNGEVPILGIPPVGSVVELNFRKLRQDENKLLQWAPVYCPVPSELVTEQDYLVEKIVLECASTLHRNA